MTSFSRNINKIRIHIVKPYYMSILHTSWKPYHSVMNETKTLIHTSVIQKKLFSTKASPAAKDKNEKCSQASEVTLKQKLKKAVAEYGSTVIVFHITISLTSLGICYLLVSSGLDVEHLMTSIGISGETSRKIATNAGTFAVAYGVHKVFAPLRIMITLTATPLIVRYLRQIGILKKSIKQ